MWATRAKYLPSSADRVSPPATPVAPGCVCDAGFYLKDDSCVPPAECGCLYQGVYYEEGAILVDDPCISYLVCTSNSMVRHWLNCDQDPKATCPVVDGKVICVCPFGTFDLHGDGSECVYCEFFGPRWTHLDLAISPNCYYFSKRERDFDGAQAYCANHHGMWENRPQSKSGRRPLLVEGGKSSQSKSGRRPLLVEGGKIVPSLRVEDVLS
ncbi:hypothetical protein ScPMuIL_007085 [Solemya velum]